VEPSARLPPSEGHTRFGAQSDAVIEAIVRLRLR
jgi:hypothetical protein